jgi:release factor glutamine methyltransferase
LFSNLPKINFDYIFINPPYYPKKPKNIKEQAWFCGENFEYFKQLFNQLGSQLTHSNDCYMILSDACELATIGILAKNENLHMKKVFTKKMVGEENYIFQVCLA